MDVHALYKLLEKYRAGNCSPEELVQVQEWYDSLGGDRPDHLIPEGSEAASILTQQKLAELRSNLTPVVHLSLWKKARRWVAVLAIGACITAGIWYWLPANRSNLVEAYNTPVAHDRHITLPDGSTVVLHADSRLEYPAAFTGDLREVTLIGEAYFDIKKDTAHAFVIHSGQVRTTVLGTAFNIKAYEHSPEITVSVTRGKVKVERENDRKLLAVLTPDQQVVYNKQEALAQQQPVIAANQVNWAKKDMVFENDSFEAIAEVLSARYQCKISFENEGLKRCPIRVTFNGTESLEEVLSVLCAVRNATFTIEKEQNVIIKGESCE